MIVTNDAAGPVWALSLLGSGGSGLHVLLPVALDAVRPPARLSVGYRVWTLENGKESTLSFSCQGLDDIGAMSATAGGWTEVGEGTWTSGDPDAVRTVDVPPCVLDGKKFVCLRWSVPKKKSSPIIGIADVRVTAAVEPSGFLMYVR